VTRTSRQKPRSNHETRITEMGAREKESLVVDGMKSHELVRRVNFQQKESGDAVTAHGKKQRIQSGEDPYHKEINENFTGG